MKKLLLILLLVTSVAKADEPGAAPKEKTQPERITSAPTPNFVAPTADEHPRLLLRKTDIPKLRAMAATERGKAIIQGLLNQVRYTNPDKPPGHGDSYYDSCTYAALYQLTGDTKYADLSRKIIERYYRPENIDALNKELSSVDSWSYGFNLMPYVAELMSYDLCYDAWAPEFRTQVAQRLGRVAGALGADPVSDDPFNPLVSLTSTAPWSPGEIAGPDKETFDKRVAFARLGYVGMGYPRRVYVSQLLLLGLRGDPETPAMDWNTLIDKARDRFERLVPASFGEHGRHRRFKMWGYMITGDFQLDDALLAWRNAGGRDYTGDERVSWIHLQWVSELLERPDGGYWVRRHEGASFNQVYGGLPHTNRWNNFAADFAMLNGKELGALLWSWNHTIKPGLKSDQPERLWDIQGQSYRAVLSALDWPEDAQEINPAEIMPRPYVDHDTGSVVFRNRWQDNNDVVIDCWCGAADDFRDPVVLWARGKRTTIGFLGITQPEQGRLSPAPENDPVALQAWRKICYYKAAQAERGGMNKLVGAPAISADGSGSATYSNGNAIAVDFSPGDNLDVLVAMTGPGIDGLPDSGGVVRPGDRNIKWDEDFGSLASDNIVTVGEKRVRITTIGTGPHPQPVVSGDTIQVGNRVIKFAGDGLKIEAKK